MTGSSGFNRTLKILAGAMDILIYHVSFLLSFYLRYQGNVSSFNFEPYLSAMPFIMVAFIIINILLGIYTLYNKKTIDVFSTTVIAQFLMLFIVMAMTFFGRWFAFPRTVIFLSFFVSVILLFTWRALILNMYDRTTGTSKIMLVGKKVDCIDAIRNIKAAENDQYKVVACVVDNYFENIKNHIDEAHVFYLLDSSNLRDEKDILTYLTRQDKRIFLGTDFDNLVRINNRIMSIDDENIVAVSKFEIAPENEVIKRLIDTITALILIVLTSPLMLIAAILVKATSPGPVLYKQVRITKGEREFEIYKFRTMREDAEKLSGPVLASAEDPRITKVGRYLRSLRIDELPQLFNVLKGDMSLVGPRPERPFFVDEFKEQNPYYYLRHNVRAGITGYAQVYGKYSTTFNNKLKFDLIYIKNYSFFLDIEILFQTVKILFDKVSSQGLQEEESVDQVFEGIEIYK